MRVFLKFFFGFLFVASVVVAAVIVQLHSRDLRNRWDPVIARKHDAPIPVRTVTVMIRPIADIIGGTAVTEPSATATIAMFAKDGEIADRLVQQVYVSAGSEVKQGQTLIQFDDKMFTATVAQRRAALEHERYELAALKRLYNARSVSDLEWRKADLDTATAELAVKLAEYELETCTVVSPLNGIVDSIEMVPGMRVTGATQLAVIHQLDPIYVTMDFPVERLQSLKVGQTAQVVLDAFPGDQFEGKIARIATSADVRTRVLPVTVAVPNPENRIRAGITGYVRLPVGKSEATTIPQVAVIDKRDRSMVFCVQDGRARIREVETGSVLRDGEVEIIQGLHPGEEIVVYGHNALQDNDVVNADWRSWTNLEEIAAAEPDGGQETSDLGGLDRHAANP